MKTTLATPRGTTRATVVQTLAMIAACAFASPVVADEPAQFDSPEAAVKALQEAAKSGEKGALGKIFGSAAGELLSGDEIQDKADLAELIRKLEADYDNAVFDREMGDLKEWLQQQGIRLD